MLRSLYLTVFIVALHTCSSLLAAATGNPLVGGKAGKEWLVIAANHLLAPVEPRKPSNGGVDEAKIDRFEWLTYVAEQQVQIGDRPGANKTIDAMERLFDKTPQGGIAFDVNLDRLASAEISAGRMAQANKALERSGRLNLHMEGHYPIQLAPLVARASGVDQAVKIIATEHDQRTRIRFLAIVAWGQHVLKRDGDCDRVSNQIFKELATAGKDGLSDADQFRKMLVLRGRCEEVMAQLDQYTDSPEVEWSHLLKIAASEGKSKSVSTMAGLILARLKKQPLESVLAEFRLACEFAEAGAVSEGQALMQLASSRAGDKATGTSAGRYKAEFAVWTHDPTLETILAGAGNSVAAMRFVGFDEHDYCQRMAHAFAVTNDPARALEMVEKINATNSVEMFDVMACEARVGKNELAIEQLKKIRPEFAYRASEYLARGWAQGKDTKGLPAWIDSLETPLLRYFAAAGVAEGMLHIRIRNAYLAPSAMFVD